MSTNCIYRITLICCTNFRLCKNLSWSAEGQPVQCWCRIERPWRAVKTNACPLTGPVHIAPICWWVALILWSVPWNMPSKQQKKKNTLKEDNHCESYRTFFVSLLFPSNRGLSHERTQQDGGKPWLFARSCGHFPHSPGSVSVFWNSEPDSPL